MVPSLYHRSNLSSSTRTMHMGPKIEISDIYIYAQMHNCCGSVALLAMSGVCVPRTLIVYA